MGLFLGLIPPIINTLTTGNKTTFVTNIFLKFGRLSLAPDPVSHEKRV